MRNIAKIGVLALLFTLVGCASIPEVPLCDFHKKNPGGSYILYQLWDACSHGDMVACDAYGRIAHGVGTND